MDFKKEGAMLKIILSVIGVGVWVIVLQNAGLIPSTQEVEVINEVETHVGGGHLSVSGSVDVDNTVEIEGDVSGYMDVNIEAINGNSRNFYDFNGNGDYCRIPVYTGN